MTKPLFLSRSSISNTVVTMILLSLYSLFIVGVDAFIPNAFTPYITDKDYTHQDLTERGILLAVAEYFESKAAPGQSAPPQAGSLTGIVNITARKLFDTYYGSYVPEKKFQSAIDDIVNHNSRVDRDHPREAAWHFNGEQISQGNDILLNLRSSAFDALNVSQPNYATARNMIGQYLHVLQDFYSNTNWKNINTSTYYSDLGVPGKSLLPIAASSEETCKNCGALLPCLFDQPVLPNNNKLTSGYRSGQDIVKPSRPTTDPQGKCSHGGKLDTSATTSAAVGGINKETTTAAYSPLSIDHNVVSDLAIQHTKYFFSGKTYGLRAVFGDSKFENLLQLHAGISLCFVIDTSVSTERDAIKQEIQKLVSSGSNPYNYILVYTNQGQSTPTVITKTNGNDIISAFSSINIPTNHSCTYSVSGTEAAVTAAEYGSKIYVFSDATPKNDITIRYIQAMATEKDLRISFLLTGQCKQKRSTNKWSFLFKTKREEQKQLHFTHQFLVPSGSNWIRSTSPITGKKVLLSVRINDPDAIISLDSIRIGNLKQALHKLKRGRMSGVYSTFISDFPKIQGLDVFVQGMTKDGLIFQNKSQEI
ncbi:von Willebrand factor A domain-containing protein 7-like [Saccostrea echinata]|uniref:von Willebrand factor A domain-containing protein 7-like n=1 Tax=Saccostrea echinata TaxID=191078 RepID=UPI002A82053E|nr:von Willebrand factor A domain-containing protein 7-like [Saccostrea echinata]